MSIPTNKKNINPTNDKELNNALNTASDIATQALTLFE